MSDSAETPSPNGTTTENGNQKITSDSKKLSPEVKYFADPGSCTYLDVFIVIFYHMLPFTPLPMILSVFFLQWGYRTYGITFPALYTTVCVLLVSIPPFYSRRIRNYLRVLYTPLARYMAATRFIAPSSISYPEGQKNKAILFAVHPHGRMFYSQPMIMQMDNIWRKSFLPQGDFFSAAAGGFFWVPFLRNLLYFVGAMPASRANIVQKLKNGDHVSIVVGGVREVCVGTNDKEDILYLKKRKGFIKIALEQNVGVVPIYLFNENQLFHHDPKWFLQFWGVVNRFVNVGVPFMRGIGHLPIPFRRELLCVIGDPIFPSKDDTVDSFHERYISHLTKLFDEYVKVSPRPSQKLRII